MQPIRVAVIGAGYWGPNLVRNFHASDSWDLAAVCDLDETRAKKVAVGLASVETSVESVLERDDIDAVAVATPAATHRRIALAALAAGKHVLVEKPLADTQADAEEIVAAASDRGLVLMCDHTYCYTPVVQKIADLVADGSLGDIHFVDSVRINLGLVQRDVNVIWDLAPHDLSILDYILPGGLTPVGVAAHGADPLGAGRECVGYLNLPLASGALAHIHVNWLSPTKMRQMVIGGSRRTLVWDDLNPGHRLSVYDRGVDLEHVSAAEDPSERTESVVSYRLGDMLAPALPEREALGAMVEEFAASIREGHAPRTDGGAGLRVIQVLEAASRSLSSGGALIPLDTGISEGISA
ncbi:MAG: Gfo/Idh/MocA family oxidoreductase [Dermatophilaceae bacterium]